MIFFFNEGWKNLFCCSEMRVHVTWCQGVQGFRILLGALFRKVRKSKVYVCASEGTGLPMRYYKRGWVCITQSQIEPQANLSSMLACLDVKRGCVSYLFV